MKNIVISDIYDNFFFGDVFHLLFSVGQNPIKLKTVYNIKKERRILIKAIRK